MADTPKSEAPDKTEEQRPIVTGDRGQDDAYATESNPEGLRYGEKPHKPGALPPRTKSQDTPHEPTISVGDE
jgi:hypothetical protein